MTRNPLPRIEHGLGRTNGEMRIVFFIPASTFGISFLSVFNQWLKLKFAYTVILGIHALVAPAFEDRLEVFVGLGVLALVVGCLDPFL